jgi:asparagine synthase (glutamine-hydrolysing)
VCGIAGIYHYRRAEKVCLTELVTIRDAMFARGPDDHGLWISENNQVGFGHRRLAIIDPGPSGHQPMLKGDLVITFNGEIYNYKQLKSELISQGYHFKTNSDTEVLLALYQQLGSEMLTKLSGMFVLAIWDQKKETLFLARDPYGIKPLYFAKDNGSVRFASSVKALLTSSAISTETSPAAEVAFLMLGYIPEPRTIFENIQSLESGHSLLFDKTGLVAQKCYASIAAQWQRAYACANDYQTEDLFGISTDFRDSVNRHLVSDVPVGVFLSAGIDSGAIAGLAAESVSGLSSTTLRFSEFSNSEQDESTLATEVASYYGLNHTSRIVDSQEFVQDLPAFFNAMDQPTVDGLNTWFISKSAAELGIKVMLSGVGGDELLGSYPAFERIPNLMNIFGSIPGFPQMGDHLAKLRKLLPDYFIPPKYWGMLGHSNDLERCYYLNRGIFLPWELPQLMEADRLEAGLNSLQLFQHIKQQVDEIEIADNKDQSSKYHGLISTLESSLYMRNQLLRDSDWASMAHSIEVRTPLVDFELIKSIAPKLVNLPNKRSKFCLANAPAKSLPDKIQSRKKTGFTTPIAGWIENSEMLSQWKRKPLLGHDKCHWSRRYVYSVLQTYKDQIG